jgi:multidrug efflux pump subunit AcrB
VNRIIEWFIRNSVATNLLVLVVIVGGVMTLPQIRREIFPEFSSEMISVTVLYPGAAPEEVEEGICVRIEEAVQGLEGLKKISSNASEGLGSVTIELLPGVNVRDKLDEVKGQVDAIDTFPELAEKPIINEVSLKKQVVNVAVSGNADEATLKRLGERVRDELSALPGISYVELVSSRPYEISIEVSEEALRRYGLTFDRVAQAVRRSSLDLPGGSVKTRGGEILLRTKGQAYRGPEFEQIVLLTKPDGSRVHLGNVANVVDGFAETDQTTRLDGEPAVMVQVYRSGDEDAIRVAEAVYAYVASTGPRLPEGISMTTWQDDSRYLRGRLELLLRNARTSLILVIIMLSLFMRLRLAFWIMFGITFSFLGTIWVLPFLGVSISLISLFAFILVLGIVVDDAIVTGENIYTWFNRTGDGVLSAIKGTQEVATPVVFGVFTTIAAFVPLLIVPGNTGKIMRVIPLVVISALIFSLIESKTALPTHLKHLKPDKHPPRGIRGVWRRMQSRVEAGLQWWIARSYRPSLEFALRWRYVTVSAFMAVLLLTVGMVGSGRIKFTFFPTVEGEAVAAFLTMPLGTSSEVTAETIQFIEERALETARELEAELGEEARGLFRHVQASSGEQPYLWATQRGGGQVVAPIVGQHLGEVVIELAPSEERTISAATVARRWRELTGEIPDAVELTFSGDLFSAGAAVNVQLAGPRIEELRVVADKLKLRLSEFPGVKDLTDSFRGGKKEVQLSIKPSAEVLGLTQESLARQVRQAFYGEEAQRVQRGRDEVKVMVRYPEDRRRSLADLEDMRIRTPDGSEVPFSEVSEARLGRGYANITRVDRQRTISVTADVDASLGNATEVNNELRRTVLPEILADHPNVQYSFEGEQREQGETLGGLLRGFVMALFMIYALLAIPLRSYIQPFLIMSAIPFGIVGAVIAHFVLGMDLSILSMFGIVALAGVVVNDSLVMVDYVNRNVASGMPLTDAVRKAGMMRFRPILLTSLTTSAGLMPIILEKSLQARFLIPMALSLAGGVLFATFITLMMIPCGYTILEDIKRGFRAFLQAGGVALPDPEPVGRAGDDS